MDLHFIYRTNFVKYIYQQLISVRIYFQETPCHHFVNHVIYASPYTDLRAYSSAGERFVDIEEVTGSIPVTPTIIPFTHIH